MSLVRPSESKRESLFGLNPPQPHGDRCESAQSNNCKDQQFIVLPIYRKLNSLLFKSLLAPLICNLTNLDYTLRVAI